MYFFIVLVFFIHLYQYLVREHFGIHAHDMSLYSVYSVVNINIDGYH